MLYKNIQLNTKSIVMITIKNLQINQILTLNNSWVDLPLKK